MSHKNHSKYNILNTKTKYDMNDIFHLSPKDLQLDFKKNA